MTIQILDDTWSLTYDSVVNSTTDRLLLGAYTSTFIGVSIDSPTKNPVWLKGGTISREILLPDSSIALANSTELRLGEVNFIQFDELVLNSYNLYYLGYERLENVRIRIWEYLGQTEQTLLPQIANYLESNAQLQIDLSSVTDKLEELQTMIVDLSAPRQSILYRVAGLRRREIKLVKFWENLNIPSGLRLESLFIDSPEDDRLDLELSDRLGNKITDWSFRRNETPYEFPKAEFSNQVQLKLELVGASPISSIFIYVTPTIAPLVEDIA